MKLTFKFVVLGLLVVPLSGCGFLAMGCDSGTCIMTKAPHHHYKHHHHKS